MKCELCLSNKAEVKPYALALKIKSVSGSKTITLQTLKKPVLLCSVCASTAMPMVEVVAEETNEQE